MTPRSGHEDAVVQEPVEQADGRGVLGEEAAPVLERPVRADAERSALVSAATMRKNSWAPLSSIGAKPISSIYPTSA